MNIESISLSKFLSRYANVYGADLKRMTHDEVKVLFPELRRASNNPLKTKNDVLSFIKTHKEELILGKVVLVSDGRTMYPYYTPELTDDMEEEMYVDREETKDFEIDDEVYDYSNLSEYELRELLRRKYNSYRNQTCARRELQSRGIAITKKYRRNDFKKNNYEEE